MRSMFCFGLGLTLAAIQLQAQTLVRVAQEASISGVGQSDFDANILGVIEVWDRSNQRPGDVYSYGSPIPNSWNGDLLFPFGGPIADRSHVMLAQTMAALNTNPRCSSGVDGISLFWVHDRGGSPSGNPDGGCAKTIVNVINSSTPSCRAIQDGDGPSGEAPPDVYSNQQTSPTTMIFFATNDWDSCCTDGYTIDQLNGDWTLYLRFADYEGSGSSCNVLSGLNSWSAFSADGTEVPLVLEVNRRVQLRPLTECEVVAWPSVQTVRCADDAVEVRADTQKIGPATYEWQFRSSPATSWAPLLQGTNVFGSIQLFVEGSPSFANLRLSNGTTEWQFGRIGYLRCKVVNSCGTTFSNDAIIRRCGGDLNGDGVTDGRDLSVLLSQFGTPVSPCSGADANNDGLVNGQDLSVLLGGFGTPC